MAEAEDAPEKATGKKGKKGKKDNPEAEGAKGNKQKYRKDKPWDTPDVDKWKVVDISKEDIKGKLLTEETSFAILFPAYREQYIKSVWQDIVQVLAEHELKCDLNLVEGSMTVKTTKKTWDPFVIIKAREMIKLVSRSLPLTQAKKILQDDVQCDIIKISGLVRNKEKFVKRRQRLVGPNGSTLKAIELLTQCHVLVQGRTVSVMGSFKGLKEVRKIVEDCFRNMHPIYHIKELMIKRELEKDPELKNENWERFLPKFKAKNRWRKKVVIKKRNKTLFPPQQTPRKEDLQMETGEYFLNEQEKAQRVMKERHERHKLKAQERKKERAQAFEPPSSKKQKTQTTEDSDDVTARLKERGLKEKKPKKKTGADLLIS